MKGNPHWDKDELWTTMGHLYKGGMWLLKKAHISGYTAERASDGTTDLRTTYKDFQNNVVAQHSPSATDANKYFFLPRLGFYMFGMLYNLGEQGRYWASNAYPTNGSYSYSLDFAAASLTLHRNFKFIGCRVLAFE